MSMVRADAALESKARGSAPGPREGRALRNPLIRVWEGEAHGNVQHREASPSQTLNGFQRLRLWWGSRGQSPLALLPARRRQGAWA